MACDWISGAASVCHVAVVQQSSRLAVACFVTHVYRHHTIVLVRKEARSVVTIHDSAARVDQDVLARGGTRQWAG